MSRSWKTIFLAKSDLNQDQHLYEMIDYDNSTTSELSGSNVALDESTLQEPMLKSSQPKIPCRCFEIEEEAFRVNLYDEAKPRTIKEALSCSTNDMW